MVWRLNDLQVEIMRFIDYWARTEKTPIPRKKIVAEMKGNGVKVFTTVNALNSLIKKGYIRRAVSLTNKTSYVMLRGI